ncbi:hypothetical protein Poly51_41380 [Rubripirellula tenax]|uniref:GAF domain-containing protein n=1 Tax=Rubripirellula tenax TaxID=2528015 RepID=A0A5C6EQD1_9BACT|nr:GAF domain-containing protein [Rubripirellula tenax]TWU50845.1 hypothetical protein Poly51_41380 [Rubripirellula tenax]
MIAQTDILTKSLLVDLRTFQVRDGRIVDHDDGCCARLASKSIATGMAEVLVGIDGEDDFGGAVSIPIYRGGEIVSTVVMAIAPKSAGVGVFEIWEPVEPYEEVRLRGGYFASLERFSNVSSYVRFEKGNGLPGQVWSLGKGIIHDNLPEHPGFLRAAGASAGLLQTAIGVPVLSENLMSAVVLISSAATPIARGYQVWLADEDGFVLDAAAYQAVVEEDRFAIGTKISAETPLIALARDCGGAVISGADEVTEMSRSGAGANLLGGLAIPFYSGEKMQSITALLF